MNIRDMIEVLREDAEVEIKELNEKDALIFLPEYQIHYRLHIKDWYFVEAVTLINAIEIKKAKISKIGEDVKLFSANDLLELRIAIREDINKIGGIYESYFFDEEGSLKDGVDKRYLLDYITFIDRAFFS